MDCYLLTIKKRILVCILFVWSLTSVSNVTEKDKSNICCFDFAYVILIMIFFVLIADLELLDKTHKDNDYV